MKKPEPDSKEWWQEVAQGLGIRCFDMQALLGEVDRDLHDWLRFARQQMEQMPDWEHTPYGPTTSGVDETVRLRRKIADTLRALPQGEAAKPEWTDRRDVPETAEEVAALRADFERFVRSRNVTPEVFAICCPWASEGGQAVNQRQTVSVTFTLDEWDRILKRADALLKASNGHSFMTILKTRCQYCGRSPRARGKCPQWPTTFAARILFVLMNKEQELALSPSPVADDEKKNTKTI